MKKIFVVIICLGLLIEGKVAIAAEHRSSGQKIELSGELIATNTIELKPLQEGSVIFCPWSEGDHFIKGEKLVEIDRSFLRENMLAAKAKLKAQKNALASIRSERFPYLSLKGAYKNTLSDQPIDSEFALELDATLPILDWGKLGSRISQYEELVNEQEHSFKAAQALLDECVISAPFDGVVTRVYIKEGDVVGTRPFTPLLEIMDPKSIVARFALPESYAFLLDKGDSVKVKAGGKLLDASIETVYPQLDSSTHTRLVEAKIEESSSLPPGMFVRIFVNTEAEK